MKKKGKESSQKLVYTLLDRIIHFIVRYLDILLWIFIVTSLGLVACFLLSIPAKTIIATLNLESNFVIGIIGIMALFCFACFILLRMLKNRINSKQTFLSRLNGYFWIFIFLAVTLMVIGYFALEEVYKPEVEDYFKDKKPFEKEGNLIVEEAIEEVYPIECKNNHMEFILNDDLNCEYRYKLNENTDYAIRRSDIFLWVGTNWTKKGRYSANGPIQFQIPLESLGMNRYLLKTYFSNSSYEFSISERIDIDVKSLTYYEDKKSKKVTYLLSLVAISLFSMAAFVNNLKNIMEPKT